MRQQRQDTLKGIRVAKDTIGDKMRGVREGSGGTSEIQKLFAEIEEVSVAQTSSSARSVRSARSTRSTPRSSRRRSTKSKRRESKGQNMERQWSENALLVGEKASAPAAAAAAQRDFERQGEQREKSYSFGLPPHLEDMAHEEYSLIPSSSMPTL